MWSHDVIATEINLAGDLKIGQYRERSAALLLENPMLTNP